MVGEMIETGEWLEGVQRLSSGSILKVGPAFQRLV